jgi:fumarylacetoacetate (FAA) hydrolase
MSRSPAGSSRRRIETAYDPRAVKLCMFAPKDRQLERGWPGRIEGDRVIQLAAQTLQSFFTGGGKAREHAEFPLEDVRLLSPVLHPPSVRLFEPDGVRFAFGNPASMYGPEQEVPWPGGAPRLEARLRVAAVIGDEGQIGGFTIMNDWRAPELPPAKDADFATSLGPVVVTPDELKVPPDARIRVDGEERWRGWLSIPSRAMVGQAARNTRLLAGDVLGGVAAAVAAGISVELEVDGIGRLASYLRVTPTR